MSPDTRKLLTAGTLIFSTGAIAAALVLTVLGGIGRQGPHNNGGWLCLMLAMGCLPTGLLTLVLGLAKLSSDLRHNGGDLRRNGSDLRRNGSGLRRNGSDLRRK